MKSNRKSRVTRITEDFQIPGTNIILEPGDRIRRHEANMTIPKRFGMFTQAGNARLSAYAEELVNEAASGDPRKALRSFFESYHDLMNTPGFEEAGDTDVRDQVRGFGMRVADDAGVTREKANAIWREVEREAYRR